MSEWQPIETCPRSFIGYRLNYVLFYNGNHIGVGYRRDMDDVDEDEPDCCDETDEFIEPQPTHWMPLPEPPTTSAGGEHE